MEPVGTLVFDKYLPLIFMILTPSFTFTFFLEPNENPLVLLQYMRHFLIFCLAASNIVFIQYHCDQLEKTDYALRGSQL